MERAAILIGVSRTGQLPILEATSDGVRQMAGWAASQGISKIQTFTDENGNAVTLEQIKKAVRELTDAGTLDQLIIYFAGHGMYNLGTEYWLLTDAPEDSNAAVSVALSQDRARIGSCPHVIFISDACRTAVSGQQFAALMGGNIFPSPAQPARPEQSVDLFFACGFDSSSMETRNGDGTSAYRSIYTDILHDALIGKYPAILQPDPVVTPVASLVRTQALKPFLTETVPNAILQRGLPASAVQTPDARICSSASAWISRISPVPSSVRATVASPMLRPAPVVPSVEKTTSTRPVQIAVSDALEDISIDPFQSLRPDLIAMSDSIEAAADPTMLTTQSVARRIRRADQRAPDHFETGCGFFFTGAQPGEASVFDSVGSIEERTPDSLKIVTSSTTNVLVTTSDGCGTILPAIPGYIASLSFHDGLLTSVSWQQIGLPSDPNLVSLRSLIASLSQRGSLHLDTVRAAGIDAQRLANRIRGAKTVDPSMAIYAAYAFYDLQLIDRVRSMAEYLLEYAQLSLFDLALLTRSLSIDPQMSNLKPFFPLLSRGWSMLELDELPPLYSELFLHMTKSHWTFLKPEGVELLKELSARR